jgi:carboxymethylenebutenolidase
MRCVLAHPLLLSALIAGSGSMGQSGSAPTISTHPAAPVLAPGQSPGKVISYPSGNLTLTGTLYLPKGQGPFPVVVWNHGADKDPSDQPELGDFYTRNGLAFFVPLRRGHGANPGKTVDELLKPYAAQNTSDLVGDKRFVSLLENANADVAAAVRWIRTQPEIDSKRIVMSGISYGGLETLIYADTLRGISGFIVFSGGARLWDNPELQQRLFHAVNSAMAPIFLIEAENDYGTGPVDHLGPILNAKESPNRAKLYPAFGSQGDTRMGHVAFATWNLGTDIWGPDVLAFIQASFQKKWTPQAGAGQ